MLGQFLSFLALDIASHPERLQVVDASFVQHIQSLVDRIEVDLDAPLSAEDECRCSCRSPSVERKTIVTALEPSYSDLLCWENY